MAPTPEWKSNCTPERLDEMFSSHRAHVRPQVERERDCPRPEARVGSAPVHSFDDSLDALLPVACSTSNSRSLPLDDERPHPASPQLRFQASAGERISVSVWVWVSALVCGAWVLLWLSQNFAQVAAKFPH